MKIAIIGLGKMGKLIKEISLERNHTVLTVDPFNSQADFQDIKKASLTDCNVCIDFTTPEVVLENIKLLADFRKNIIVGTTGWYDKLEDVKSLVESKNIGLLYASNFSIGVNVFYKIVSCAAQLINKLDNYDISGLEYHHNQKKDSPSGTAQTLTKILLENIERKTTPIYDTLNRKIEPYELQFSSVRCGSFPGTHEISFDSPADTISLKHTARNRSGFAYGVVLAAEWLNNKKGLFTIDDVIINMLTDKKI